MLPCAAAKLIASTLLSKRPVDVKTVEDAVDVAFVVEFAAASEESKATKLDGNSVEEEHSDCDGVAAAAEDTKLGNRAAVAAATAAAVTSLMVAEVILAMDRWSPVDTTTGVVVREGGKPALRVRPLPAWLVVVVGADAEDDEIRPAVNAFFKWLLPSLRGDEHADVDSSLMVVAFEVAVLRAADWTAARA